jgi:hypothetical protein
MSKIIFNEDNFIEMNVVWLDTRRTIVLHGIVLSLGGIFMAKLENKFAKCNIITLF